MLPKHTFHFFRLGLVVGAIALMAACARQEAEPAGATNGLSNAASFQPIDDDATRSRAIFDEMFKVISHPRCSNCHSSDDYPRQGEDMRLHEPPIGRGPNGFGPPGLNCSSCHGIENVEYASSDGSIPGHEIWMMPPRSMGWLNNSAGSVCNQLKDPSKNGERSLEELVEHNLNDSLVGWGWNPGEGREPAPGTQHIFGELTRAWVKSGAHCPTE